MTVVMGLIVVVCLVFVFAMVFGKQPPKSTSQATLKPQALTISEPSPMQLAIHRDNESGENDEVEKGCLISLLMVILIGVVVLLVALSLIGQAIDGFFEGVRDFFDTPLNPFTWF